MTRSETKFQAPSDSFTILGLWVLGLAVSNISVSARSEFLGVIDDPLFENLGVIGKFRGSELFLMYNHFLSEHASILKVFEECPLS